MYDSRTDKAVRPGTHRNLRPVTDEDRFWEGRFGWVKCRKPLTPKREAIAEGLREYRATVREEFPDPRECMDVAEWEMTLLRDPDLRPLRWDEEFISDFKRELTTFLIVDWTEHRRMRNRVMRAQAQMRRK